MAEHDQALQPTGSPVKQAASAARTYSVVDLEPAALDADAEPVAAGPAIGGVAGVGNVYRNL